MPGLSPAEKILLSLIIALSGDAGCFASETYLAENCGLSRRGLQRAKANLIASGLVTIESTGKRGGVLRTHLEAHKVRQTEGAESAPISAQSELNSAQSAPEDERTKCADKRTLCASKAHKVRQGSALCAPIYNRDIIEIERDISPLTPLAHQEPQLPLTDRLTQCRSLAQWFKDQLPQGTRVQPDWDWAWTREFQEILETGIPVSDLQARIEWALQDEFWGQRLRSPRQLQQRIRVTGLSWLEEFATRMTAAKAKRQSSTNDDHAKGF